MPNKPIQPILIQLDRKTADRLSEIARIAGTTRKPFIEAMLEVYVTNYDR